MRGIACAIEVTGLPIDVATLITGLITGFHVLLSTIIYISFHDLFNVNRFKSAQQNG